jgi:hypothetical protein
LPQDKESAILGNGYEARKESTLLITSISDVPSINNIIEIDTYWRWMEVSKKFEFIKTIERKAE